MAKVVVKDLYHKDILGQLSKAKVVFTSGDGMKTEVEGKVANGLHNSPYEKALEGVAPWRVTLSPEDTTLTYSIELAHEETPCSGDLQMEIDRLQTIRSKAQALKDLRENLELGSGVLNLFRSITAAAGEDAVLTPLRALGSKLYNEVSATLDGIEGVTVRYIDVTSDVTETHTRLKTDGMIGEYLDIKWPRSCPELFEVVQKNLGGRGGGHLSWDGDHYTLRLAHGSHHDIRGPYLAHYSYGTKNMEMGADLKDDNGQWTMKADGQFILEGGKVHISADQLSEASVAEAVQLVEGATALASEAQESKALNGLVPLVAFAKDGVRMETLSGYEHLQRASVLAPVNSPLVIKIPAGTEFPGQGILIHDFLRKAKRTEHVGCKDGNFGYRLDNGMVIQGRFDWTHA